jgi:hypothetical protein
VAVPPKKSGSGLRPEDLREKESVAGTLVPAQERRERQYWLDRENAETTGLPVVWGFR